jgi:hypothetical protein
MVAPTCFGITLPSSGSVPSAFWEMLKWGAVDRILWMGVVFSDVVRTRAWKVQPVPVSDTALAFNVCRIFRYKIMPLYQQVYNSWCTASCNDTVRNADYMASGNWERVMSSGGCGIVVNLKVLFRNLSEWATKLGTVCVPAETETTSRIKSENLPLEPSSLICR